MLFMRQILLEAHAQPWKSTQKKKLQPSKFGSHGKKETILNGWIYSKSCQYRGLWLMFQWQALTFKLD